LGWDPKPYELPEKAERVAVDQKRVPDDFRATDRRKNKDVPSPKNLVNWVPIHTNEGGRSQRGRMVQKETYKTGQGGKKRTSSGANWELRELGSLPKKRYNREQQACILREDVDLKLATNAPPPAA